MPLRPRIVLFHVASISIAACVAGSASAQLSASELEELGTTVKAAVASGAISEADAIALYGMLVEQLGGDASDRKKGTDAPDAAQPDDELAEAKGTIPGGRLVGRATSGDLTMHLEPLILGRDLARILDELALDAAGEAIASVLFQDLLAEDRAALDALRDARARYERTRRQRALAITFDRVFVPDAATASERADERLRAWRGELENDKPAGGGEGDAKNDWAGRVARASTDLHARLETLRVRFEDTLAARPGDTISAETLARRANELRQGRRDALASFADTLAAATGADAARAHAVVRSIDRDHRLGRGLLAGESTAITRALDLTLDQIEGLDDDALDRLEFVRASLRDADAQETLDALLHARDEARLDREARGLAFLAARDRIVDRANARSIDEMKDEAGDDLDRALRPLVDAMRRELAASIAVRDALLATLVETEDALEPIDEALGINVADRLRSTALDREFPRELRVRWCERAFDTLDEAPADGIDPDLSTAIDAIRASTEQELAVLRDRAIRERIRQEPRRVRSSIDRLSGEADEVDFDPRAAWVGYGDDAFRALDERTEDRLRAVLPPALADRLPVLKRDADGDALARWMKEKAGSEKNGAAGGVKKDGK